MTAEAPQLLSALNRLKAIALEGLRFTTNPYDIDRYNRLLDVTANAYSEILRIDDGSIIETFRSEIGVVTPGSWARMPPCSTIRGRFCC